MVMALWHLVICYSSYCCIVQLVLYHIYTSTWRSKVYRTGGIICLILPTRCLAQKYILKIADINCQGSLIKRIYLLVMHLDLGHFIFKLQHSNSRNEDGKIEEYIVSRSFTKNALIYNNMSATMNTTKHN